MIIERSQKCHVRGIGIDHSDLDGRIAAAIELMLDADWEVQHVIQVRGIALAMFDGLDPIHHMGADERIILEAGALLHDIGFQIGDARHHKSSYEIIRERLGPPWAEGDALMAALVARYHRKARPAAKHPGFGDLSGEDRATVSRLAAILRVADGLDRSHGANVRDVTVDISDKTVTLRLVGEYNSTDEWGATRKSGLFAQVFGREIVLEWNQRESPGSEEGRGGGENIEPAGGG